jgi:hypothetical protein
MCVHFFVDFLQPKTARVFCSLSRLKHFLSRV